VRVLIIGGTRYMGRAAVERMLARGDDVAVFSRGRARPSWWDRVEHIAGDRTDRDGFRAALRGRSFDGVIDMRAFRREDVESAHETFLGHVGRYLMVSTGSVYGDGAVDYPTHCPLEEADVDWAALDYAYPPGQDAYGVGKRHCEKWLQEHSRVPYTIVRVPAVMAWDDPTGRMWWWVQRALDGRGVVIPMEHRGAFPTLYALDAAESFLRALDAPRAANQTYHIASQQLLTVERWVGLIWEAAGAGGEITFVPEGVIHRRAGLADYRPPLTRETQTIWKVSRAEQDFGLRTTPPERWIRTTVEWYRDEYHGEDAGGYAHRAQEADLAARWRRDFAALARHF
jgi:nucleoside-diphosphate-sugar epimerase